MKYECKKCNKIFDSFRKLGGHSSSHSRYEGMRNGKKLTNEFVNCVYCKSIIKENFRGRKFCSLKCKGKFQKEQNNIKKSLINKFNKTILFLELYRLNNPICEICGNKESVRIRKKKIQLAYDHDHLTNEFRGMLCFMCNTRYDWFLRNQDKIFDYMNKKLP